MTRPTGVFKKPAAMAPESFARMFGHVSKQALIDALWCACQLGTNETDPEIEAQAARNVEIALRERGDRVPRAKPLLAFVALLEQRPADLAEGGGK